MLSGVYSVRPALQCCCVFGHTSRLPSACGVILRALLVHNRRDLPFIHTVDLLNKVFEASGVY